MIRYFRARSQAGRLLAQKLKVDYANKPDVLVLGLPRGGVPVAYEVAKVLHAPLDICSEGNSTRLHASRFAFSDYLRVGKCSLIAATYQVGNSI